MPGFSATLRACRKLRTAIFIGMVPLVVLNGWPAGGCICADGHYEPICRSGLNHQSPKTAAEKSTTHSCCERACCAAHSVTVANRSRGQASKSCCQQSSECQNHKPGLHSPCCRPVAQTQVILAVNDTPSFVDQHPCPAMVVNLLALHLPTDKCHRGNRVEIDTGPPPNDLVVSLQRLLI